MGKHRMDTSRHRWIEKGSQLLKKSWLILIFMLAVGSMVYFENVSRNITREIAAIHPSHIKSYNNTQTSLGPWRNIPEFIFYLRFTSGKRSEWEYRNVFLRTLKLFVTSEQSKLVVVLDGEKTADRLLGKQLKHQWPYPEICYSNKVDPGIYHNWGKARMFYDMMHPDLCTDIEYVAFVDTDTFFATLVTPDLLFEDGKPVVVAKIGIEPYHCWPKLTEIFLGEKEVLQCMSSFPIMMKTAHMKEMREFLSKKHGKSFDLIFRDSATEVGDIQCMCQFSIMCNYVWYHHRTEYSWHLQMVPDGNWSGQNWLHAQVPVDYYRTVIKPEMKIPIPRVAIHLRYTITSGKCLDRKYPPNHYIEDFIREGLCYSIGFDICEEKCKRFDRNVVHYNLFSFECYQWFWDKRCLSEQKKHYRKVGKFIEYYRTKERGIFGNDLIENVCSLI